METYLNLAIEGQDVTEHNQTPTHAHKTKQKKLLKPCHRQQKSKMTTKLFQCVSKETWCTTRFSCLISPFVPVARG